MMTSLSSGKSELAANLSHRTSINVRHLLGLQVDINHKILHHLPAIINTAQSSAFQRLRENINVHIQTLNSTMKIKGGFHISRISFFYASMREGLLFIHFPLELTFIILEMFYLLTLIQSSTDHISDSESEFKSFLADWFDFK